MKTSETKINEMLNSKSRLFAALFRITPAIRLLGISANQATCAFQRLHNALQASVKDEAK